MYEKPKRRRLTKQERQAVYEMCGGHCAYCGCEITAQQMQVDHVQPISLYGKDELKNMLPACHSCNNYKHSLLLETFRRVAEGWHDNLLRNSAAYRIAVRFGRITPTTGRVEFYFEREAKP